ncbi:MAG: glycosyltransferase WbsX family protein [Panacagrimonas sp.]
MKDTQSASLPRTTCDLSLLGNAPSHRGAVELLDLQSVSGWCLSAEQPQRPVALEISCQGVVLGTSQARTLRPDLTDLLGFPCHAGFAYHWMEIPEARRDALIAALEAADAKAAPVNLLVRVLDAEIEVDSSLARSQSRVLGGALARHLRAMTTRPKASGIAEREAILRREPAPLHPARSARVRALAFYLPQFHAIPENDQWWGPGFTEWIGVTSAKPAFAEHAQPRIPTELGYYDLRMPGVIEAQIELARSHGLAGFCFHHYWFGGQRLLQKPLERFLEIEHDFGFCLCWANEPWSRRWDGSEQEMLMPQPHSIDQDVSFIHDVLPLLKDPRYIRVDGKPILIVYRVGLLSDPLHVFEQWRRVCEANDLPGLHICMAETFGASSPFSLGCDSSVEFPPHSINAGQLIDKPGVLTALNPDFKGKVYDYAEVVASELAASDPEYPRYKTVMLDWDNTSRRGMNAHVCTFYSPALFERWLEDACQRTERNFGPDGRLLFVNAWNEWGEGTCLEPDFRYGRANLEALRRVVVGADATDATFDSLVLRLHNDPVALAALDRIRHQVFALQRSLGFALEHARHAAPYLTRTWLSAHEPLGIRPLRSGGQANIEQIGRRIGQRYLSLKRGDIFYLTARATPDGRTLLASTLSFLKLTPVDAASDARYALVMSRSQRQEAPGRPSAGATSKRWKQLLGPAEKASVISPLTEARWIGFTVSFDTQDLPGGRYRLSVIFPAEGADSPGAVEVALDGLLEIAE